MSIKTKMQSLIDASNAKTGKGDTDLTAAVQSLISESGGGGSVPKPLTYDYMPEGYPSKMVQTTVLMEEQEVAFTENGSAYKAVLTDGLILVAGQTYTVNWDGTEYECVCSELGQYLFIGNLSISAGGEDTGEPFIYTPANKVFATLDTSPSHTISVTTSTETITPMAEEFLPPTYSELDNTLTVSGAAADAAVVGDAISALSEEIAAIPSGKDGVGIESVVQTTTSTEDGGTNVVTVTKTDDTSSTFQVKNGSKGSTGDKGADGKSAYQYAVDGGYTGTEAEFEAKLAAEMPDKLPNPNALTFTGAVEGSYDGSAPLTVNIPSAVTDEHINSLIDAKLGVIENGSY